MSTTKENIGKSNKKKHIAMKKIITCISFTKKKTRKNITIVMLPDELFVSLIDTDLQKRIAMADDLDGNAAEALKLLLESTPTAMTTGLEDWTLEEVNG